MFNGEVFSINVPIIAQEEASLSVVIADGCANNSNYYTDGLKRGTCCCGCDKPAV